jgi:hypothetical protein
MYSGSNWFGYEMNTYELSGITVFKGRSGEEHGPFGKHDRWLAIWNMGEVI